MKLLISAVVIAAVSAGSALAENAKPGWGIQFRQDTFDKTLFPISMMQQEGDQFDKSMVGFACGIDGNLVSFFQTGMISLDSAAKVQFRDGDATTEVTFTKLDVPNFGARLAVDGKVAAELSAIFERAAGSDVPFRTGSKQGAFSSIGATKTFEILKQNCPAKS
ncbi:hypothetical protein [uncultured Agrobacterium sp.]|uniref:hypothetical protein n=1 Tax=uncultured Agrobacterium sp. TaxID=157277 RepID=UPI00258E23A2|nr:hypothetical protein [uncultured Agrobacterium sp.]